VLRVEWQITPRLAFALRNVDLRLTYELSDRLDLLVYGRAQTDRYRLERRVSGTLAADAGSIGIGDASVGLGLVWDPSERWRVTGSTGVAVWGRVFVADSEDDKRAEREMTGAAPVVTLRVQRRF